MEFDKVVGGSLRKKTIEEVSFDYNYGLDIDMEKIRREIRDVKQFTELTFMMSNANIQKILCYQRIHAFKKICRDNPETSIQIERDRKKMRKIIINGEGAYKVYLAIKALL